MILVVIIISIIEALSGIFLLIFLSKRGSSSSRDPSKEIEKQLELLKNERAHIDALCATLTPRQVYQEKEAEMLQAQDTLKVEKGRVTITYAELETVEGRLRELHEIERELAASSLETQEELKILQARENELKAKAESLHSQIQASNQQIEMFASELETNEALQEEIARIQVELQQTQSQVTMLRQEIESGNRLYFALKRQYDALDIEYAQLYEKYALQIEGNQ
jgi:chromosome segregation ATPase